MIKKIISFLKQYWLFILLAAAAAGLLVIYLIPKPSPQEALSELIPANFLEKPKITGLAIPANNQVKPADWPLVSQLRTYQGQENKITQKKAETIAQELGFFGSAQKAEDVSLGTFLIWNSNTHYLAIAIEANKVEYGLNSPQSESQLPLPSAEKAQTDLEKLLEKLELNPHFEPQWQKEKYLVQTAYLVPTINSQKADFIKVGFNPSLDQFQLVSPEPHEPLISLILNRNGETVRFQYQVFFSDFEKKEIYDLKTKEEVQTALISEGKIVYAGTLEESVKEPQLAKTEFNQIEIAYFQEPDKNPFLQPIFILSGQATLASGEKTAVVVYLPAIASKWFKAEREHFKF